MTHVPEIGVGKKWSRFTVPVSGTSVMDISQKFRSLNLPQMKFIRILSSCVKIKTVNYECMLVRRFSNSPNIGLLS